MPGVSLGVAVRMTTEAAGSPSVGKYSDAVKHWETVLGTTAPNPVYLDQEANDWRLSSEFAEWVMGLPSGWVTNSGLSRKDELKLCGNGVVPQQAALAIKSLLNGVDWNTND